MYDFSVFNLQIYQLVIQKLYWLAVDGNFSCVNIPM